MAILRTSEINFKGILSYPKIEIEENQVTFICGESGAGKSTLLKLFNGTLFADSGTVFYDETNIEELDTIRLRQEVMLVNQKVYLFKGSILENFKIFYGYRNKKAPNKAEIKKYLALCCADFSLEQPCESMSGGEKQRVYIAICLSMNPRVLMLDEPTSALDEKTSKRMLEKIKTFCHPHNMTLIVISHDPSLSEQYADRRVLIERSHV